MGFDEVHRVRVGELPVAYREAGEGEPLLLVHGWPLSSRTWRKVVPELAKSARCIAIDLLGAGETLADTDRSHGLEAQGRLVGGFMDALGLERATLIGHDSGGSVARCFATASPERVGRLVLADTEVPGHRPPFVLLLQGLSRLPGSSALLRSLFSSKALARSPVGFGLCFADLGRFDFDEFFEVLAASTARSPEALRATRRFMLDFDFADVDSARARYDRLAMPKLVIWGERDRIFPLRVGRRLAEMLPDPKRFAAIGDAGLLVHEERPGAWVETIRSFLQETSAS